MRFHPDSSSARVLREFNPCHDAKSGQFAAKGAAGCDPGQMTDPGRQRAFYGQLYEAPDVGDRLDFAHARPETKAILNYIGYDDRSISREKLKAKVAEDIADSFSEEEVDLANEFFNRHSTRVNAFLDEIGSNENSEEHYRSEYDTYVEEQVDAQRQAADQEAYERWGEAREDYRENVGGALDAFKKTVAEKVGPYGDLSMHPELPMAMFGAERQSVSALTFLQNHFPDHFDPDTGFEDGFEELLADPDHPLVRAAFADLGGRRIVFDEGGDDLDLDRGSTYFESGDLWARDGQKFIRDAGLNAGDYFEADYQDIDSFGDWLENVHGITEESLSSGTRLNRPAGVVGYLINKWSDTSGDADPMAIAMQMAIEQEFRLGATFSGQFIKRTKDVDVGQYGDRNAISRAEDIITSDGPFLRRFARRMYENTQRELKDAGLDWITVYRGFGTADTPELKTVNFGRGEVVDILLQPASSFSADRGTAENFAGYYHIGDQHNVMMAMRIPRSQVLGTPRTGYGAWNEHEVVVLGGRYPAVVMARAVSQDIAAMAHEVTQRYLRRRNPPQVVIGQGDRL